MTNDCSELVSSVSALQSLGQGVFVLLLLIAGMVCFLSYRLGRMRCLLPFALVLGVSSSAVAGTVSVTFYDANRSVYGGASYQINYAHGSWVSFSGSVSVSVASGTVVAIQDPNLGIFSWAVGSGPYEISSVTTGSPVIADSSTPAMSTWFVSIPITNNTSSALNYSLGTTDVQYGTQMQNPICLMPGQSTTISVSLPDAFSYSVASYSLGLNADTSSSSPVVSGSGVSGPPSFSAGSTPYSGDIGMTSPTVPTNTASLTVGQAAANVGAQINAVQSAAASIVSAVLSGAGGGGGGLSASQASVVTNNLALQSGLDSNILAAILLVNTNLLAQVGELNGQGFATNNTLYPATNVITSFPVFTSPNLTPISPSILLPFSSLNAYLPSGVSGFDDQSLDWSTQSFWSSYIDLFRSFQLFLITFGFIFMSIRTVKGISS